MQTKKIINDGNRSVDEMLEGILAAHPRHLLSVDGSPRSIIARDGPRPGKVGLVIGGGSGHEPTVLGFVGRLLFPRPFEFRLAADPRMSSESFPSAMGMLHELLRRTGRWRQSGAVLC